MEGGKDGFMRYQLPAVLWAVLIFAVSSVPTLRTPYIGISFIDKIAHFFVFGIFGLLLARAFSNSAGWGIGRRAFSLALLFGVIWGGVDEIHQAFVPGRFCSIGDFVADGMGVVVALLILSALPTVLRARATGETGHREEMSR